MSKPRSKRNWCANGTEFLFHKMHSQLKLLLGQQTASGLIALCTRISWITATCTGSQDSSWGLPMCYQDCSHCYNQLAMWVALVCLSNSHVCLGVIIRETNTSLAQSFPRLVQSCKIIVCRVLPTIPVACPFNLIEHCCTFQLLL